MPSAMMIGRTAIWVLSVSPMFIAASQCGTNVTDVDEVAQLQMFGLKKKRETCEPHTTYYLSLIAEAGSLKVAKKEGGKSWGTLTMTGKAVERTLVVSDRPIRKVGDVGTATVVKEFKQEFDPSSGGHPNAVVSGKVKGADIHQSAIVLTGAQYGEDGPTVTWEWTSDDDVIDKDLEFEFVTLFVDSLWCIIRHPKSYIENKLCSSLAGTLVKKGVGAVTCLAEDLAGLGLCAAIDVEDGEILTPLCEGLVVGVCTTIVSKISQEVVKEISDGHLTIAKACENIGYGDPC